MLTLLLKLHPVQIKRSREPNPETQSQTPCCACTPTCYFFFHQTPAAVSYLQSQKTLPVFLHSTTISQFMLDCKIKEQTVTKTPMS